MPEALQNRLRKITQEVPDVLAMADEGSYPRPISAVLQEPELMKFLREGKPLEILRERLMRLSRSVIYERRKDHPKIVFSPTSLTSEERMSFSHILGA